MGTVKEIEAAVSKLSREELSAFRAWFAEFDAEESDYSLSRTWLRVVSKRVYGSLFERLFCSLF
jgi:hypothetical protein